MMGDGHCDEICNTPSCLFDSFDCECSKECTRRNFMDCDSKCTNYACNYANYGRGHQCDDEYEFTVILAVQAVSHDFFATKNLDACGSCSWKVVRDMVVTEEDCLQSSICASKECLYNLGLCPKRLDESCNRGFGSSSTECFECKKGYMQLHTTCLRTCPKSFEPNSIFKKICTPIKDDSTAGNPDIRYVRESKREGTGSLANPYGNLGIAFASVWKLHTVLYLLGDSVPLSVNLTSSNLDLLSLTSALDPFGTTRYDEGRPQSTSDLSEMIITSLTCQERWTVYCSGKLTAIDVVMPVVLTITRNIIFQNVTFTTKQLFWKLPVQYCPVLVYSKGKWLDANENEASAALIQASHVCDNFTDYSVFVVKSSGRLWLKVLVTQDVEVHGLTIQPKAFINILGGSVNIVRVNFTNIHTQRVAGASGVILQWEWCDLPACGSLLLENVTVSYLNNGVVYSDRIQLQPFLRGDYLLAVHFRNVVMHHNFVTEAFSKSTTISESGLLYLKNFYQFFLENCEFRSNIVSAGLAVVSSLLSLPRSTEEGSNEASWFQGPHLVFSNLTIVHNVGAYSLVAVQFAGDVQNIDMTHINITHNGVLGKFIITLSSEATVESALVIGATELVLNSATGLKELVWIAPRHCTVSDLSITGIYSYNTLAYIKRLANVALIRVYLSENGDIDTGTLMKLYHLYFQDPGLIESASVPVLSAPMPCAYSLWCDQSVNVTATSLLITNNSCSSGSCGLRVLGNTGVTSVSDYLSQNNKCTSQSGLALEGLDYINVTIRNFSVSENVNLDGSMATFGTRARVNIADSSFHNNAGKLGVAIRMAASESLTAQRVTCRNNTASRSTGGALYWLLENFLPVSIQIANCEFENNEATRGGALALEASNSTTVNLQIHNSRFIHNSADLFGAALYVGMFIDFDNQSTIQSINFTAHRSASGVVYLLHRSGLLRFSECRFTENTGSIVAVLLLETEVSAVTMLEDTVFSGNHNAPTLLKSNSRMNSTVVTRRCVFLSSENSDVVMEGGVWRDFGSFFSYSNTSKVLLSAGAMASLTQTRLENNFDVRSGGAIHLLTASSLTCFRCTFLGNSAGYSGGAIFSEQNSYVVLEACTFRNNSAGSAGGVLYIVSSLDVKSIISSSLIEDNDGGQFGIILLQSAVLTFDNVTIQRNFGINPGISALMSTVSITHSRFRWAQGDIAIFLALYTNGIAAIWDSEFTDAHSTGAGLLQISSTSHLTVTRTSFLRLSGSGVITAFAGSIVSLSQVTMVNIEAPMTGSLVTIADSTLFVEKSTFTDFGMGGFDAQNMQSVEIRESIFSNGMGIEGAAGGFFHCKEVVIVDCSFQRLNSRNRGGALLFESLKIIEQKPITILRCKFTENSANDGGSVYSINNELQVTSSRFTNNSAKRGGALMLECSLTSMCSFNVTESEFIENFAELKGGAVAWTTIKPHLAATFRNNSAPYGSDIASYPISLKMDEIRVKSRLLQEALTFAPGQSIPSVIVASLRDHYGQVITIDNSSVGAVESIQASVSGTSKVYAEKGVFTFDNFIVYARPNSSVAISISSTAIEPSREGDPDLHSPSLPFTIFLRDCEPGEVRSAESCTVCSAGTYSFDPKVPCQTCSGNAQCLGGYIVVPDQGYWRSSIFSATLHECPNSAACLGGGDYASDNILSLIGRCATGFQGNLCQSCADDYSRTGKNKCDKCPPKDENSIKLSLIAVAVLIGITIMVWSTMRSATRPTATHSIMIRIFVNYLQLVLLVTEFKLSWPQPVLKLFETQESAGTATEQAYSVDCFLAEGRAGSDTYFRKMIFIAVLPVPLILGAVLFWLAIAMHKRSFLLMKRECLATIVILFFLILPNLIKEIFSMFSCREIESGEYWLTVDMDIRCWNGTHTLNVLVVGVPAILLWVLAVPLVCLYVLVKYSRQQDELWMKMQYGFLINGYRRRCFYWEFVILYRKILIICCAVFLNNSVSVQALTVQLVLLFALFLQYQIMPYKTPKLNSLEVCAITVADVTIYSGLYYLSDSISESMAWFLFLVILFANLIFLVYWLAGLLEYFIDLISLKYHCIGRVLKPSQFIDCYIEEFVDEFQDSHPDHFPYATLKECYKKMIEQSVLIIDLQSCGYIPRNINTHRPTSA